MATSLLVSEKMKKKDLHPQMIPEAAQNPLLKYALGPQERKDELQNGEGKTKDVGAGLKSALKEHEARAKRKMEIAKLQEGQFNIDYNAVRMPNKKLKLDLKKQEEKKNTLDVGGEDTPSNNMLQSPSNFLTGQRKRRKDTGRICICGRMPLSGDEE